MALPQYVIPSFQQNLNLLIADYVAINKSFGNPVQVFPGTEVYARLYAIAQLDTAISYQGLTTVNQNMVDTATGSNLDRLASLRGIYRKGATQSEGNILFYTSATQSIVAGAVLNGPSSLTFQVLTTGTYSNGQYIPIQSIVAGSNTNLPVGTVLTWSSPPYNSQPSVPVATPLTGGTDLESDDALRARLILVYQYPPQAGNTSQIAQDAGLQDPLIQQPFIYPNYNGTGTMLVALTSFQTTSYIGRDLPSLPLDNYTFGATIANYGINPTLQSPGLVVDGFTNRVYNRYSYPDGYSSMFINYTEKQNQGNNLSNDSVAIISTLPCTLGNPFTSVVCTVNNYPVSLSILLSLPYPQGSNLNAQPVIGANGWTNYNPWPNPDPVTYPSFCPVVSITSPTQFVIGQVSATVGGNATGAYAPIAGVTQISWINRSDYSDTGPVVQTATINSFTDNGNNTWTVTISTPFSFSSGVDFYGCSGLTIGDPIFPASVNAQNYLDNVMSSFSLLGPGNATISAGLVALGANRFPSSAAQYPAVIDDRFLQNITANNPEVEAAQFITSISGDMVFSAGVYQTDLLYNGSAPYWAIGSSLFAIAPPANSPPNVYIPAVIGFYDLDIVQYYQGIF